MRALKFFDLCKLSIMAAKESAMVSIFGEGEDQGLGVGVEGEAEGSVVELAEIQGRLDDRGLGSRKGGLKSGAGEGKAEGGWDVEKGEDMSQL